VPSVWEAATGSDCVSCVCSLFLFLLDLLPCGLAAAWVACRAGLNREGLAGMLVKPSAWPGSGVKFGGNCDRGGVGEGVMWGSPVPESPAPKGRLAGRSDPSHRAVLPGPFVTALVALV